MSDKRIDFPQPEQERKIHVAWDRFRATSSLPQGSVRASIERSWLRCRSAGVDPRCEQASLRLSENGLHARCDRHHGLIEASVPLLTEARELLSDSGTVMILADPEGFILRLEGDPRVLGPAGEILLLPGNNWTERSSGTNAIGTAMAARGPVQVHAAEHYCYGMQQWTCTATVVRDLTDGQVLGTLDISGLKGTFSHHTLALVTAAAKQIEERLAKEEAQRRARLWEAVVHRFGRLASRGLLIFDREGRLVHESPETAPALRSLGIEWDPTAACRIDALSAEGDADRTFRDLPDWLRRDWIEAVADPGERLGSVVVVPELAQGGKRRTLAPPLPKPAHEVSQESCAILGESEIFLRALEKARRLAAVDVPVLLHGETGTGKEMFALTIHEGGRYRDGPFIALNCGGLSRELLASELFGYTEGAFTGAKRSGMIGKLEAANGGTLFLDEIGEMPLDLQPYLLRVLEDGRVYPLGSHASRRVDFRLVAATNRDLKTDVAEGRFRRDLYYRLAVTSVFIPPLRERIGDISILVAHFIRLASEKHQIPAKGVESQVLEVMTRYHWPGNVRELRNVVEGMVIVAETETLAVADLPDEIQNAAGSPLLQAGQNTSAQTASLEGAEREAIRTTILACQGNLTEAARELGIAKSTLYAKVKKHRLERILASVRDRQ